MEKIWPLPYSLRLYSIFQNKQQIIITPKSCNARADASVIFGKTFVPGKVFFFFQSILYLNASTSFILKLSVTIDCIPSFTMVRTWKVPEWGTKYKDYANREDIRYGFRKGTTNGLYLLYSDISEKENTGLKH